MSFYGMENFAFADVSATFNDTQTTLSLDVGDTDRFNDFPALATLTNITDFPNAHEAFAAGDAEIIEIVSKDGDTFDEIKRGQDFTTPISSTVGANYRVSVVATRSQWEKVCRAHPDASGPFDAILEGNPGTVIDAVARFVLFNTLKNCIFSIQGSDTNTRNTAIRLGWPSEQDRFRINLRRDTGVNLDQLDIILNALEFLTFQGRDRMGIRDAAPAQPGGVSVGQTMSWKKMIGFKETGATISGGSITNVIGNLIRVSAEGGPGSDDLDEILLNAADIPENGNRMIIIVEPQTTAHDITIRDKFIGGGNITLQGSAFEYVMNAQKHRIAFISDGIDNDEWVEIWRTRIEEFVNFADEKTLGTSGGTFTSGAWRTRDLQTEIADTNLLASVAANQITLEQGDYWVRASAPAYRVGGHLLRLQNITDGSTLLRGENAFAQTGATGSVTPALLSGRITLPTSKLLELQHQCAVTKITNGFGGQTSLGTIERYAQIEFVRRHDD